MTAQRCSNCGREPENGVTTHWIGCPIPGLQARVAAAEANPQPPAAFEAPGDVCEHDGCSQPRKKWSGKGAKPKYCAAGHKREK
ncbi:hypothetical protein HCJ93_08415 [Streptomyces sp. SBST2-5]|jgi:hypothetical protein|uniref:Uncharacterized protein n=1 Tax=Streptomyces composti TaxID=2720025 RepID=A0ABX1A659_9ACTN|nr:hypothetical protein [Streptomyces composti]NJP50094.1 hypothetical protein [Streptomyces composti]